MRTIKDRLEYLRGELRAERISCGELHELQSLAGHINPNDVELLEAAGVPEGKRLTMSDVSPAFKAMRDASMKALGK